MRLLANEWTRKFANPELRRPHGEDESSPLIARKAKDGWSAGNHAAFEYVNSMLGASYRLLAPRGKPHLPRYRPNN